MVRTCGLGESSRNAQLPTCLLGDLLALLGSALGAASALWSFLQMEMYLSLLFCACSSSDKVEGLADSKAVYVRFLVPLCRC